MKRTERAGSGGRASAPQRCVLVVDDEVDILELIELTLLRMGLNIGIYFVGGLVPLIGDIFAIWWKPNIRNLNLLRQRATVSAEDAKRGRKSDWLFVGVIVGSVVLLFFGSIVLTISVWWYVATHLRLAM